METTETLPIEVAYALPEQQWLLALEVPVGCTVKEALALSGISDQVPELTIDKVGIFGAAVPLGHVLRADDRIEIYRVLIADPKQARKNRAARAKKQAE